MLSVLLITTAVIIGAFVAGLAGLWKRRAFKPRVPAKLESDPDASSWFYERPTRWLAIRCPSILKVQSALGVDNPTPCSLLEGFARLNEHKLFISPPVNGWILVIGNGLPDAADDPDKLFHFLMKAARQLGSIQYFCANRVLSHHAWVRIENERVYRAYVWAGETLWNEGDRTAAENELELKCYSYTDAPLPFPFTARDSHVANTDKVTQLAARWSVDPMTVINQRAAVGIAGEFNRR